MNANRALPLACIRLPRSSAWPLSAAFCLALALCLAATPALAQTTATVSVNATATMATVPSEAYGVDTAVYDGYLTNSGVAASLKSAGINAIRYPGGSYADIFNFISGSDQTLNGGAYFAPGDTFNNFMGLLVTPEGGKPVITVNYGSNNGATGPALPSEAASWVQYANVTNNYGIVYWEIGNEVYGNGYYGSNLDWEEDLHVLSQTESNRQGNSALSPTAYGTNAAAFIKAMKAVDPSIKCGVFVNTASYYTNWDQDVLTGISNALSGSGYTLDFVIVHWYPGGTNAQVLAAQSTIAATVAQIRSDIANYYKLSNGSQIQIAITESGAPSTGGLFPSLFASDDYLTWIENGASNVEYQELHNGFLDDTSSNTPLGPWYGAQFSSTVARVGDNMVTASSSNALLRAHAVNRTDGQVGVILINDDPSNNTTATVNISNATLSTSGTQYNFGNANYPGGGEYASSGISQSAISGVGSNFTVTVPAYSETAILIPKTSGYLIANGTYILTNENSGLVVDDPGYSTTEGTYIDQWSSGGGNNQKWTLTNLGNNYVELINATSGYALEVYGQSTANSAKIDQWPYHSGTNQIWKVVSAGGGYYELLNENSGLALEVPSFSKTNGTDLDQYTVNGGTNQLWSFTN